MANLKLTDVEKTYGGTVTVLRDIDLDIEEGELIVFVGPSGCGKSTLLRMIAGLEKITGGTLEIDGMVVNDVPPSQRGIAMVFQSYALYPHMTVYDNMAFALKIAGDARMRSTGGARRRRQAAADEFLDRLPKALSGGQRQRVAIGRSIVRDPKVYPVRRAALEPRRGAARGDPDRDRAAQGTDARIDDDLRHPRPGGGDDAGHRIVVLAGGGIAQVGSRWFTSTSESPVQESGAFAVSASLKLASHPCLHGRSGQDWLLSPFTVTGMRSESAGPRGAAAWACLAAPARSPVHRRD
jgi:alpha-glucoside transport system ATP-binding protein